VTDMQPHFQLCRLHFTGIGDKFISLFLYISIYYIKLKVCPRSRAPGDVGARAGGPAMQARRPQAREALATPGGSASLLYFIVYRSRVFSCP